MFHPVMAGSRPAIDSASIVRHHSDSSGCDIRPRQLRSRGVFRYCPAHVPVGTLPQVLSVGRSEGPAPERAPRWTSARAAAAAATGAVLALVAFLHRDVLFRGQVYYYRDIHLQWIVQAEAFVRCFKAGSWPVWNPYVSFGQAFLANPNAEVYYPLTWLNLVMM